jgi:hypothetical protein
MQGKAPRIGRDIGLFVVTLLVAASAAAQDSKLYRWVDKDGHVHYGDQPGANSNASPVNIRSINTTDNLASDPAKAAAAQKQAEACKQKSDQFGQYQKASTITETDALGNKHEYSADEKNQLIAKTQKYLDDNCGGSASATSAGSGGDASASAGSSSSSGGSATP